MIFIDAEKSIYFYQRLVFLYKQTRKCLEFFCVDESDAKAYLSSHSPGWAIRCECVAFVLLALLWFFVLLYFTSRFASLKCSHKYAWKRSREIHRLSLQCLRWVFTLAFNISKYVNAAETWKHFYRPRAHILLVNPWRLSFGPSFDSLRVPLIQHLSVLLFIFDKRTCT